MRKLIWLTSCSALLLLLFSGGEAMAQNTAANGDFELQDTEPWVKTGSNDGAKILMYDVNGNGSTSLCWSRQPGSNKGNGGITQDVILIAGTTYDFTADVVFICTC